MKNTHVKDSKTNGGRTEVRSEGDADTSMAAHRKLALRTGVRAGLRIIRRGNT
jgi:hypothetical protein